MAVERFSKTGLALLTLAIGFLAGLAIGFIGAYHGSNYWYSELSDLEQEKIDALERSIRIYQKDLEGIWPEEK